MDQTLNGKGESWKLGPWPKNQEQKLPRNVSVAAIKPIPERLSFVSVHRG
jgi:hypothetical protein